MPLALGLSRRVLPVVLAAAVGAGVAALPARAVSSPLATYVPVTNAEKRATRPLAESVVAAYRSGRFRTLCGLFSPSEIEHAYGTLKRCQQAAARFNHPCANRCSFRVARVLGAYVTARDRDLKRKTLAWIYVVRG